MALLFASESCSMVEPTLDGAKSNIFPPPLPERLRLLLQDFLLRDLLFLLRDLLFLLRDLLFLLRDLLFLLRTLLLHAVPDCFPMGVYVDLAPFSTSLNDLPGFFFLNCLMCSNHGFPIIIIYN